VKINGCYYREVLLSQQLLPAIRQVSGDFVLQQDSAPAHTARETIKLLQRETPHSSLICGLRIAQISTQ